jgi:hypothetical protein
MLHDPWHFLCSATSCKILRFNDNEIDICREYSKVSAVGKCPNTSGAGQPMVKRRMGWRPLGILLVLLKIRGLNKRKQVFCLLQFCIHLFYGSRKKVNKWLINFRGATQNKDSHSETTLSISSPTSFFSQRPDVNGCIVRKSIDKNKDRIPKGEDNNSDKIRFA